MVMVIYRMMLDAMIVTQEGILCATVSPRITPQSGLFLERYCCSWPLQVIFKEHANTVNVFNNVVCDKIVSHTIDTSANILSYS
jgi:hypothetical protein